MNATLISPTVVAHSMTLSPQVVPAESGRFLDAGDHRLHILISSAQSGGDFVIADMTVDFQGGPPPHIHSREDETFMIQSGYFEAMLGEERTVAGPGDTIFAPRGVPHCWRCVSEEGGRVLVLVTPGENFEQFFVQMCEDGLLTLPLDEAIPLLHELSERYGLQMLPPSAFL